MSKKAKTVRRKIKKTGLKLIRSNIVIIADTHNPSIISSEWLSKYCYVKDKAIQFFHTPEFSLFESDNFAITVDRSRLEINTKLFNDKAFEKIANIATNYVKTLIHIPYISLGLNYIYRYESSKNKIPIFKFSISNNSIPAKIGNYKIENGCIIYGISSDHRMKLLVEILSPEKMGFNVNFNFDVKGKPDDFLLSSISLIKEKLNFSSNVINNMFLIGGKNE